MRILASLALVSALACASSVVPLPRVVTGLSGGAERDVVLHVPVVDARGSIHHCGYFKSGMIQTDYTCSEDPSKWIQEAVRGALNEAGFRVVDSGSNESAVHIRLSLRKLFVEFMETTTDTWWEADFHIVLAATSESGLVAERELYAKGVGANQQLALELGARRIVRDVVGAVLSLANRYPQLGAVRSHLGTSGWEIVR